MRSFIFTLLLFGVMLVGIVGNAIFIHRLSDDLLDLLDTLPAHAGERESTALDELEARWEHARTWVSLSVSYSDMNRISHDLASLRAFCEDGEDADYFAAREQLRLAIEDMRRFEMLALDNLI